MRHKHPAEYNSSIKVALVRVAWSEDEDLALARLELKLKQESKGQIVNRLAVEWSKMVKQGGWVPRSKTAIRGRRQQPDYKRRIERVRAAQMVQLMPTATKKIRREAKDGQSNHSNMNEKISKFLSEKYLDSKNRMPSHIIEVLQIACNPTGPGDSVE